MANRGDGHRFRSWCAFHRSDLLGIGFIVGLIILFLAPSVKDGGSFGGFDFDTGRVSSLGAGLYSVVHTTHNGDAVSQMISWNALDWRLVHNGQFPLWNPYSVLGMPEFFNFESSVLSLPDIVSYAVPIQYAFLVVVAMKLLIAGTGVYAFCRAVGVRAIGATFGASTFMLAGAFVNWVTWPLTDVVAWTGWIGAFAVLAYRTPTKRRYVVLLAMSVAFSIFGGFPEANVMLVLAFGAFIVVAGIAMLLRRQAIALRGVVRVAVGSVGGVLLATPLWFPGLQVIASSHRQYDGGYAGLPMKTFGLVFSQGYYGMPLGPNASFQLKTWNYYESVAYVGVFAVLFLLIAVFSAFRRPLVLGLTAALLLSFAVTYEAPPFHLFSSLIAHSSLLSTVRFERMRTVSAFFVAVLAAIGFDRFGADWAGRSMRRMYVVATIVVAIAVGYLVVDSAEKHFVPPVSTQRFDSLVWPVALVGGAIVAGICLFLGQRSARAVTRRWLSRTALAVLLGGQVTFLFFAGVGIPSYSKSFYATTANERELQRIVGSSLVGLDGGNTTNVRTYGHIGFYPNVNIGYDVHLFAVHDPLTPAAYYTSWPVPGAAPVEHGVGLFVPDIDSATLARRYGIGFVIAAASLPAPTGTVRVADLGNQSLYRVPKAAQFSFASGSNGDTVTSTKTNGDGSFTVTVHAPSTQTLVLRVTSLPGWHATGDGKALRLSSYEGVMQSVVVPAGTRTIELWYLPRRFSLGIVVALLTAALLAIWVTFAALRVRRRREPTDEDHRLER